MTSCQKQENDLYFFWQKKSMQEFSIGLQANLKQRILEEDSFPLKCSNRNILCGPHLNPHKMLPPITAPYTPFLSPRQDI